MHFGKRIRLLRKQLGLSHAQLAGIMRNAYSDNKTVTRTAICQWESGATKQIEATNLLKVSAALGVNPEYIIYGTSAFLKTKHPMELKCHEKKI